MMTSSMQQENKSTEETELDLQQISLTVKWNYSQKNANRISLTHEEGEPSSRTSTKTLE